MGSPWSRVGAVECTGGAWIHTAPVLTEASKTKRKKFLYHTKFKSEIVLESEMESNIVKLRSVGRAIVEF